MKLHSSITTLSILFATGAAAAVGACSAGGEGPGSTGGSAGGTAGVLGNSGTPGIGGTLGTSGNSGGGGSNIDPDFTGIPLCDADCEDFPAEPIYGEGTSASDAGAFSGSASGAAGCIIEPVPGSLLPANWTRPRVKATGVSGSIFQITFSAAREKNDLVIYSKQLPAYMPKDIWDKLRYNVFEEDITVTVRASSGSGFTESTSTFRIAPVQAPGTMVFWASSSDTPGLDTSKLLGFSVGDEGVFNTLSPGDINETSYASNGTVKGAEFGAAEGQVRCVGCHTSTPDGNVIASVDHWPWNTMVATMDSDTTTRGDRPSYVTKGGATLTQIPFLGMPTFSLGDWSESRRIMVTSMADRPVLADGYMYNTAEPWNAQAAVFCGDCGKNTKNDQLIWINLAAAGSEEDYPVNGGVTPEARAAYIAATKGSTWGKINREGDTRGAVSPSRSNDGDTIVYTSTDAITDGRVAAASAADIYTVPFKGGPATALPGASSAEFEYYPDFSADDSLVIFNRTAQKNAKGELYYVPNSEIYVTKADGSMSEGLRLESNSPATCSGVTSPGVYNSWAKFAPEAFAGPNGATYYWYVFSSTRDVGSDSPLILGGGGSIPRSHLYVAAVVIEKDGTMRSTPAVYVWNQDREVTDLTTGDFQILKTLNVTPAWETFRVPPIPPPEIEIQ